MRVSSNLRILIIISDDECLKVTLYQNNIMSPLEKVRAPSTKVKQQKKPQIGSFVL